MNRCIVFLCFVFCSFCCGCCCVDELQCSFFFSFLFLILMDDDISVCQELKAYPEPDYFTSLSANCRFSFIYNIVHE